MDVVCFRGVDTEVFREFKAEAARRGMRMGRAITEALKLFAEAPARQKKGKMGLLDLKPVDYGPENRNLSSRVDEILYGAKT
ncbi:MAG: hypothetical protein AB1626_05750 [Candidatus Micrarchaeota archaeon]